MSLQVINAVRVMDETIAFQYNPCAQAIFRNKYRELITVINLIQGDTKPYRVFLPAPFAGF